MTEIGLEDIVKTVLPKKKSKYLLGGILFPLLFIALFFDVKYKGLFYRYFLPRNVQSFTNQLFEGR